MSDHNNTNDVTPAEIAALDHRPVCGYCGKPLGEAACKSSLPDSPMFHSASCMMKWEAERSEMPATITAGELEAEWETKWKLLVDAGKCYVSYCERGHDLKIRECAYAATTSSRHKIYGLFGTDGEYANVYDYEILPIKWLKDTPPAETQGDGFSESELTALGYELGRYGATTEDRAFAVAEFLRIHTRVQADKMAKLEAANATLTRELETAREEVIAQNKLITEAKYILHGLVVRNKSERMKVNDWLRKAAGEVSNGE